MNFGDRTSAQEARRIVERALERGATFFDTANLYANGGSERLLGELLRGRRDRVQLATKVGLLRRGGKPEGLSAARILEALEESLGRLGTDYVDLYYLHAPDPSTPLAETLDALRPLLESGRIRDWGVSNFAAWQILELNTLADARRMPRPAVSQVLYNLLVRQLDLEYFPFARRHPIHTTVYNPLAGGLLARAVEPGAAEIPKGSRFDKNPVYQRRYWSEPLRELTARLQALARESGFDDPVAFSYAWLAGYPGVDSILAGPRTVEHLDAALDAIALTVPDEVRAKVDALYRSFTGTDASYAR
jgi:aryl-alcohol dehydrogenase-like predicted oxidoreductase